MSDILLDNQSELTAPPIGQSLIYVEPSTKCLAQMDDGGKIHGVLATTAATIAQGALATTDSLVLSSKLQIPTTGMQVGMVFVWWISVTKTAAGVTAPIWKWRVGLAGGLSDTVQLSLTAAGVQAATAFDGILTVMLTVPIVGKATGTIAGSGGSGSNFGGGGGGTSAAFDNTATIAGNFVSLSITTGLSAAWTINAAAGALFA